MGKIERYEKAKEICENLEDGRLRIENIDNYQNRSDKDKLTSLFFGMLGVGGALIGLLGLKAKFADLLLLLPTTVLPSVAFLISKLSSDRKVYKLEEEIINPKENVR